jgi:hypothetical protein
MNFQNIANDNDVLSAELADELWFDSYLEQAYSGDVAYDEVLEKTYRVTMVNARYY